MKYAKALPIAESWVRRLKPYCTRITIAGSIRRRKSEVKDIEIVCIPKTVDDTQGSLFAENITVARKIRDPRFVAAFTQAPDEDLMIEMGKPSVGKYIKVMLIPEQIKLDVFIASEDNWGYILAIRTGPADYSHRVLAAGWVKHGYNGDGNLMKDGKLVPVPEEEDLFRLLHLPYLKPEDRHWP